MEAIEERDRGSWLADQREWLLARLRRRLPWASAEDATQEALVRSLEEPSSYPRGRGWLLTTGLNAAIDRWRRDRRSVSLDAAAESVVAPPTIDRVHIRAALARLSMSDAALLREVALGFTYREIAARRRLTEIAVRKRVARARARLAQYLDEGADE